MPTCVTIYSLLKTSKVDTQFAINIIASPDVTDADREIIRKQVEVTGKKAEVNFVDVGKVFENGYETRGISTACYSRLLIPWLFPQYDKIIYSDVDVIYKRDISDVFNYDLGENLVAGVTGESWQKGLINKYLKGLKLDPDFYINSGFLVINSRLQREERLKDKYLELVKNKYVYQDQDIINIACQGRVRLLPEKYNMKPSSALNDNREVCMIHYIGIKPWQYFTLCWEEWWTPCKESLVYDSTRYQQLCKGILSLQTRCKVLKKQIQENLKFRWKLL